MSGTDYGKLRRSLAELIAQYENLSAIDKEDLPGVTKRAAQIAVIKCFEVCSDTTWKHLKKRLSDIGVPDLLNNPKYIFRLGYESGLLTDVKNWFNYIDKRNDTAHDYDEAKADEVLKIIPDFIEDAVDLYEAMTGEKWNG